ncbi:MAG: acylglycerol kinase family protein, partial [Acidimicrobiales bacterium]|nr:acylglycerol kinase family protein [Acidimicrobiales bacterium]
MSSSSIPRKGSQVALLANPAARRGRAAADMARVLERLRFRGIEPLVLDSASADEALTAAHHAVATGIPRLVVVGGDGIVHMAANAAAGSPTVVGIVAAGTGNDAAESLGLIGGPSKQDLDARV